MLLLTNQMQEVQVFFVLVQYVINQLFLIPAVTNGAKLIHPSG